MKIYVSCMSIFMLALLAPSHLVAKKPFEGHRDKFDYIIVGFGSAGAILARKLSDDYHKSVLVLEAGSNKMEDPAVLDPNPFESSTRLTYDPDFASIYPVPLTGSFSAICYSDGKTWGGSAAHNGEQGVRGVPSDFNSWASASGNAQWLWNYVMPLYKLLETYTPNGTIPNPAVRGFVGPIGLTQNPPISSNALAIATATVAGAPLISDYNDASLPNVGTSAMQLTITAGEDSRRSFSAYDFCTIGEVMDEKGRGLDGRKLRVKGNAVVTRILFDDENNAIGVQYLRNKPSKKSEEIKKVYADQIILCGGSINTPALLMRSGIGEAVKLQALGIDVVVDNPNVGKHLINQYGPNALITNSSSIPGGLFLSFLDLRPYMPADEKRRIQLEAFDFGGGVASMGGILDYPESRGSVEIVSKDPLVLPKINFNMFDALQGQNDYTVPGTDAYLAVSFYKLVKAIADEAGELVLIPSPADYAEGDAALYRVATNIANLFLTYHCVGTCRMGTSIADSVVDGNLDVFGVSGLKVADASVMPNITGGNTCLPAYVIGMVASNILGACIPPIL